MWTKTPSLNGWWWNIMLERKLLFKLQVLCIVFFVGKDDCMWPNPESLSWSPLTAVLLVFSHVHPWCYQIYWLSLTSRRSEWYMVINQTILAKDQVLSTVCAMLKYFTWNHKCHSPQKIFGAEKFYKPQMSVQIFWESPPLHDAQQTLNQKIGLGLL